METQHQTLEDISKIIQAQQEQYKGKITSITRLKGLTNCIYKIEAKELPSLIFRQFGAFVEDREEENNIFNILGAKGLSPQCKYACSQYRIEMFIEGGTHPSNEELLKGSIGTKVLYRLWELHQIQFVELINQNKIKAREVFSAEMISKVEIMRMKNQNFKFETIKGKVHSFLCMLSTSNLMQNPKSLIRFCHNDLNSLNIFNVQDRIILIDFEYAGYNWVSYDIANFINQCCIDYSLQEFPYFKVVQTLSFQEITSLTKEYPTYNQGMQKEVLTMLVVCNAYWAAWSIIMVNDPAVAGFGILQHAESRVKLALHYLQCCKIQS